ncbi:uncharacterized protein LOC114858777 [Betta splendens]|uniref:lysozyme n=1 Tax=Betta splendens TaxID=158456 RepID=A0A6P7MYN6_BETSP|nr:uncharacterized protein LOC114858777 [Betta splendens]XP_029012181.1 uncharacterized protein LOC114858777 [Betta splendens]
MKMLVALLLLGCSVAQGTILSKCEVWDQLLQVLDDNPRNMRFLASLLCQAEKTGFNTSSVIVRSSKLEALTRDRRTNSVLLPVVTVRPPTVRPPVTTVRPPTVRPPVTTVRPPVPVAGRVARSPNEVQTCYGIFALCNTVACSDGKTQSLNLCGLDCSKLRDDDIRDDASCMWTLAKFGKMLVDESCTHPQASNYFTECSS